MAPTITVIDPGPKPRQVLRYELAPNLVERLETTVKIRTRTTITNTVLETGNKELDFPTVKSRARITVLAIGGDGGATIAAELEDAAPLDDALDPALRARVENEIEAHRGWRVTWQQSPSGRIRELTWVRRGDRSTRPGEWSYLDSFLQSAVIFPDSPIGAGGSWQVTSDVTVHGVKWQRTVTYRLQAIADDVATIDADLAFHAAEQALSVDPHGSTKLTSGSMTATGRLVVPLRHLVPTTYARSAFDLALRIVRRDLRISATTRTEVESSSQPIASPEP